MKMHRIWAGMGLAAIGLAMMVGVQHLAAQQSKKVVMLWHSYRAEEKEALEKVIATFNASSTDLQVKVTAQPNDGYPDKLSAAIPQGKGPDVFIFAHDRIGDWAEKKVIEPIDFWLDDKLKAVYMPGSLTPLTYRKAVYGLPMAYKSPVLFYNKGLITVPPKTTDELIAQAKKLTNKATKKYGLVYEYANFYHHSAWFNGFGARVFDASGAARMNSPEAIASFKFAAELRNKHAVVPQDVTSALVTSLFNDGSAAMVINGPWFRGELRPGLNYGVAPLPTISGINKPARPFVTFEAVMMSAKSTQKEEAFKVMTYLTGEAASRVRMNEGKQPVATVGAYKGATDPMIQVFRKQLETGVAMPNTPQMRLVWTPATTALNTAVVGGGDPKAALDRAQAEVTKAIAASRR